MLRGTTERRMKSFQQIRQRQNKTCLSFTLLKVIIFKSCVDLSLLEQWLVHTIVFHCSEMAPLSDRTSVQSKNLKKYSKLLTRAFQITYSCVHKSSDSFFFKILEKPSIVQKKMIPHIKGLDFSQR